jgi:septation ring formation regulator EzrA
MGCITLAFEQLKKDMTAAFDAGEWQRLAELDRDCQQLVKESIKTHPRVMFGELKDMLSYYETLLKDCKGEKDNFAGKVRRIKTDRENSRTYDQFQRLEA